jgi:hypothetical protein
MPDISKAIVEPEQHIATQAFELILHIWIIKILRVAIQENLFAVLIGY